MCNQVTNTFMWCCCHSVPYICQSIKSRQLCQALNLDCCKYMSSPAAALPQWLGGVKHFLKAQTSHTHTRCFHKRVYVNQFISWHFTGHIKTAEQQTIIQQYGNWYTGWAVILDIWYSQEGLRRDVTPPSPFLAVPNVTAQPSTAMYYVDRTDFNLAKSRLYQLCTIQCGAVITLEG